MNAKTIERVRVDINLDDAYELSEFIVIHSHMTPREMALVFKIEKHPYAHRVCRALKQYAAAKKHARDNRKCGDINEAIRHESNCDKIYSQQIQPFCECW